MSPTATRRLIVAAIVLVVLAWLVPNFSAMLHWATRPVRRTVDRTEFQQHLDSYGRWYRIHWIGENDSVDVSHDVDGVPHRFSIYRAGDYIREYISIHTGELQNTTLWERDTETNERGFTKEMPPTPRTRHELEVLADQLFDAFAGSIH